MTPRSASADEQAGIHWWTSLTEAERAQALEGAGWQSGGTYTPSAVDAWAAFKHRTRKAAAATRKRLRYIVIVNGNGLPPYVYDLEAKTKIMSYPTAAQAEQHATLLNRFIRPGARAMSGAGRVRHVAVGDLAKDTDAYFDTFGGDSDTFIKCADCAGTGSFESSHPGPNNYGECCETCDGTGRLRVPART